MLLLNNKNNIIIIKHWNHSIIGPPVGPEQGFMISFPILWASLVAQMVKNLSAMQETWVLSLCWENPLEKAMVTHSSIFSWRIPWTEEPGELQSMGSQIVGHNWVTNTFTFPILSLVHDKGMYISVLSFNMSISQIYQNWLAKNNRYDEALGIISTFILFFNLILFILIRD